MIGDLRDPLAFSGHAWSANSHPSGDTPEKTYCVLRWIIAVAGSTPRVPAKGQRQSGTVQEG